MCNLLGRRVHLHDHRGRRLPRRTTCARELKKRKGQHRQRKGKSQKARAEKSKGAETRFVFFCFFFLTRRIVDADHASRDLLSSALDGGVDGVLVDELDVTESLAAVLLLVPRDAHVADLAALGERGAQVVLGRLPRQVADEDGLAAGGLKRKKKKKKQNEGKRSRETVSTATRGKQKSHEVENLASFEPCIPLDDFQKEIGRARAE